MNLLPYSSSIFASNLLPPPYSMKISQCIKSLKHLSFHPSRIQTYMLCRSFHNVPLWHLSTQDYLNVIAHQISRSTSLQQLRQIFGHMILTNFLELYQACSIYNNLARLYCRLDSPREALDVFTTVFGAGVQPDKYMLPIVLKSARQIVDLVLGKQVHGIAIKRGFESDMYCESALISLYIKVGEFKDAQKVFENSVERELGSWNAVVSGLSQDGQANEAIEMFLKMRKDGFVPNDVTMVSVNSACGDIGDLKLALQLHTFVFHAISLEKSDVLMMNSVVHMYSKCSRMDLAYEVFSCMEDKNISSWTTMIVGYAASGLVGDAVECFHVMRESVTRPNCVTFTALLSACVHGGMVEEGKYFFELMRNFYKIKPDLAHYGCMADLLGRAGLLEEAIVMVEGMPMKPNVIIWGCLMGACEKYGDLKIGERVAKYLIELDPENDGVFVALSNIYASHGMWNEVERMRAIMKEYKVGKVPSYSHSVLSKYFSRKNLTLGV